MAQVIQFPRQARLDPALIQWIGEPQAEPATTKAQSEPARIKAAFRRNERKLGIPARFSNWQ